jgi:hypothetical protein
LRRNPGALAPILSPLAGEIRVRGIVVLHAAASLLPQAKPQTIYTQILNYALT